MRKDDYIHRDHPHQRNALRLIGPVIALIGLVFTIVGLASFFSSMGSFGMPQYFWCAFIGLPMMGVGLAITKFAFMGSIARYAANEIAPVGRDTFNYMAEGTKDGVRTTTRAAAQGIREGFGGNPFAARSPDAGAALNEPAATCSTCGTDNDPDAKFCDNCGQTLRKICPSCDEANDKNAQFCDRCGAEL